MLWYLYCFCCLSLALPLAPSCSLSHFFPLSPLAFLALTSTFSHSPPSHHQQERTPGGSSGGESALICERGSPLGVGTDIGGSVRGPAHFTGICSLKPTDRRITKAGNRSSVPGQEAVPGVTGPMAPDVDSLALFMKSICVDRMYELDHSLVPLPFNDQEYQKQDKLRVGYYTSYHDVEGLEATPTCQRAVLEAVEALRRAGHEVVEWVPPHSFDAHKLFLSLVVADSARTVSSVCLSLSLSLTLSLLLPPSPSPSPIPPPFHLSTHTLFPHPSPHSSNSNLSESSTKTLLPLCFPRYDFLVL